MIEEDGVSRWVSVQTYGIFDSTLDNWYVFDLTLEN